MPEDAYYHTIRQVLTRSDKHALGGGRMVVWAPEVPRFLHILGFWDHACFLEHRLEPLYTMTLLDEELCPWNPSKGMQSLRWQVDSLITEHTLVQEDLTPRVDPNQTLSVRQVRSLSPQDVLCSSLTFRNPSGESRKLWAILWTVQLQGAADAIQISSLARQDGCLGWVRRFPYEGEHMEIAFALGAQKLPHQTVLNLSEAGPWEVDLQLNPEWRYTPFFEKMTGNGLPEEWVERGGPYQDRSNSYLYLAMVYPLAVPAAGEASMHLGLAIASSLEGAQANLHCTLDPTQPPHLQSQRVWEAAFTEIPSFRCSDPFLTAAYAYRWYGLRLNRVDTTGRYQLPHPTVFEGVNAGWFRHAISYSAQALVHDLGWMHDPGLAQGMLLNFTEHQWENGVLPHAVFTLRGRSDQPKLYHARWGAAVRRLHLRHPDIEFLQRVHTPLSRYASYFLSERDPEGMHLFDIVNQWETGQEYMTRYQWVDQRADLWGTLQPHLKGIDATTYLYDLLDTLAWSAALLGLTEEAARWREEADLVREAVRQRMWNPERAAFFDVNADTGEQSPVLTAVSFYPFLTDIATRDHLPTLTQHLLNPDQFWTPHPVPSTSLDESGANAFGEWRDRRHHCPWNGRSWQMVNAHVCEALGKAARWLDPDLRPAAAELIRRCLRTTFLQADPGLPTSYEYYNPLTGQPPFFRGVDDYMHSYLIDLILRYVAGVIPVEAGIEIDPLPFDLAWLELRDLRIAGHRLDLSWDEEGFSVWLDGQVVHQGPEPEPLRLSF